MTPLYDRAELRAFLQRHGLWAKKALAQHFLCSKSVVDAILSRVDGCQGILEIGPGPGVLTGPLSEAAGRLIALEVDSRMLPALAESAAKAEVRQIDVLEADLGAILVELPEPRAVVSNMPYHITGPLLTKIAGSRRSFDRAVLMMQKEVADRIVAPAGDSDRGSLSLFLEAQFEVRRVCQAPAGAFYPPPKVNSSVLELIPKGSGLPADREDRFLAFVRSGFRAPRKTLANNLGGLAARDILLSALEGLLLSPSVRPHQLTLNHWRALWTAIEEPR